MVSSEERRELFMVVDCGGLVHRVASLDLVHAARPKAQPRVRHAQPRDALERLSGGFVVVLRTERYSLDLRCPPKKTDRETDPRLHQAASKRFVYTT